MISLYLPSCTFLTKPVVCRVPLAVWQGEAVDDQLVTTGGQEDVVHVEAPGDAHRLRVHSRAVPGHLPAPSVVLLKVKFLSQSLQ